MVIISAGVRPNLTLAKAMGVETKDGIPVTDRMETKAAGCSPPEMWQNTGDAATASGRPPQKQGEVAGVNMAGGIAVYEGTTVSNRLKVVGVDLTAIGDIDAEGKLECVVRCDPETGVYRKLAFKEDKTVGCLCLGDVKGVQEMQRCH